MVIVGWPMHLLECTLGQKMQRGSAGALRGIMPRLAGAGWVASFSGLVISLVYTVLLGLNLQFLIVSNSEPWLESTYKRIQPCDTAFKQTATSSELYLYLNATMVLDEKTCEPFEDGYDAFRFNGSLYAGVIVTWILSFIFIVKGIKSIRIGSAILVPLSFIALFILTGHYVNMNNSVDGKGISFYMGNESLPFPQPENTIESLFKDAYTQVFFSMGLCTGVH